jgi:hypothetical protein
MVMSCLDQNSSVLVRTGWTALGEAGADAFTIMRLMGHSTVTVSQRYVHPSPEAVELAFERLTAMNLSRVPVAPQSGETAWLCCALAAPLREWFEADNGAHRSGWFGWSVSDNPTSRRLFGIRF